MKATVKKRIARKTRHRRIRKVVRGTTKIPRVAIFRSSGHIYAQLIDDIKGKSLGQASSLKLEGSGKGNKTENAKQVGKNLAALAKAKGVEKVAFDRGGYEYHGRVKALAEAAREAGLKF
ncbi:MAG: 50S ribosomal protein L18 [Candidatus Doudnabacteria bacterium CG10_big_fil_rev_8_21_14_0_10_41_10]|uniref:Large ribosomal subunit protein uL18 n=1 Tax=Candidatus Doudnabacteria bacterium CG10_big_fil_rev_8_21_14_0_10_41_10 TaxID=1974551 RepID=A0A2H0VDG0_9BACT|nr:MAG: 50S ribosomal protein L18 [Candidatus Doudnabacteria bacterium CG10_big_fil_rev_8_21_14_0_10_41_10]